MTEAEVIKQMTEYIQMQVKSNAPDPSLKGYVLWQTQGRHDSLSTVASLVQAAPSVEVVRRIKDIVIPTMLAGITRLDPKPKYWPGGHRIAIDHIHEGEYEGLLMAEKTLRYLLRETKRQRLLES